MEHYFRGVSNQLFTPGTMADVHKAMLRRIRRDIKKGLKVDLIVGCGHSSTPLASTLAMALKLKLALVRKKGESVGHSQTAVSGYVGESLWGPPTMAMEPLNYIFVDDIVDTGSTVRHVQEMMTAANERTMLQAIYCYRFSMTESVGAAPVHVVTDY